MPSWNGRAIPARLSYLRAKHFHCPCAGHCLGSRSPQHFSACSYIWFLLPFHACSCCALWCPSPSQGARGCPSLFLPDPLPLAISWQRSSKREVFPSGFCPGLIQPVSSSPWKYPSPKAWSWIWNISLSWPSKTFCLPPVPAPSQLFQEIQWHCSASRFCGTGVGDGSSPAPPGTALPLLPVAPLAVPGAVREHPTFLLRSGGRLVQKPCPVKAFCLLSTNLKCSCLLLSAWHGVRSGPLLSASPRLSVSTRRAQAVPCCSQTRPEVSRHVNRCCFWHLCDSPRKTHTETCTGGLDQEGIACILSVRKLTFWPFPEAAGFLWAAWPPLLENWCQHKACANDYLWNNNSLLMGCKLLI